MLHVKQASAYPSWLTGARQMVYQSLLRRITLKPWRFLDISGFTRPIALRAFQGESSVGLAVPFRRARERSGFVTSVLGIPLLLEGLLLRGWRPANSPDGSQLTMMTWRVEIGNSPWIEPAGCRPPPGKFDVCKPVAPGFL